MNYAPKNWVAIAVSVVLLISIGATGVFASRYFKTEEKRSAEALRVAELEYDRLSRISPTISTDEFDCSLPVDMRSLDRKDVYFSILATDVTAARKEIEAILKKYPGAFEGISNSNYEYTTQLSRNNESSVSMNGKIPNKNVSAIVGDIEKLAKADFIITSKSVNSISAANVEISCSNSLVYTQAIEIKEVALLEQLTKESLSPENINVIVDELSNIRSQFNSNKSNSHMNVKKALEEASLNINISILKG